MNSQRSRRIRLLIFFLILFFAVFGLLTAFFLNKAISDTRKVVSAFKAQDLNAAKISVKNAKKDFNNAKRTLFVFYPFRIIPLFGWYIGDLQRVVSAAAPALDSANTIIDAISPYADILGLKGQGNFLGGTAQERLDLAIETLS